MSRRKANTLGLLAGFALLGAVIVFHTFAPPLSQQQDSGETVQIGGPFRLVTQTRTELSDVDLKGSPFAVFFGFTHCPEVCPTTLWEMSEALKALGPDGDHLKVLFISVDTQRDTPLELARYLGSFDPRIVGLTGSDASIAAVVKAYRAYWKKVPIGEGDYTIDHTASVYLMDARGQFAGTISYAEENVVRLEKLRRLITGAST